MVGPEFSTMIFPHDDAITSHPKLGLTLQGHVQFKLSTHLGFDIGFGYGLKRYKAKFDKRDWGTYPDIKSTLHGADIPVLLKYYFRSNKTGVYAGLGINAMVFVVTVYDTDGNIRDVGDDNGHHRKSFYDPHVRIATQVAFGIRHPLDEQLDLNVELYGSIAPEYYIRTKTDFMINSGVRVGLWF